MSGPARRARLAVPEPLLLDDASVAELLPQRPRRGHKGTFGRLLVVAGSLDYAGAALLVARAAGRAGAGLVTLAVPASLQPLFAGRVWEATTMSLPETAPGIVDPPEAARVILDRAHDALVVGPGLRPGIATLELVEALVAGRAEAAGAERSEPAAALLDAEALNALSTRRGWWRAARLRLVLTPHPGELRRMLEADPPAERELARAPGGDLSVTLESDTARTRAALLCARRWGQVVVLKGARTVIASPDGAAALAPFENPALASGGTGDVLSGTIGALLAQRVGPWDAARLGVYLHGLAGEAVSERLGDAGLIASDLPDEVARARRRLALARERGRAGRRLGFGAREVEP